MRSASALLALAAAVSVAAQAVPQHYNSELDMTVDPNTVDPNLRQTWCNGQQNTCLLLCDNNPQHNGCTASDLTYDCTCASNKSAPGLQYYVQTMPTYICQYLYGQCANATTTQAGSEACTNDIENLCGELIPPAKGVSGGGSSSSASSASSSAASSASTAASSAAAKKTGSSSASGSGSTASATKGSATSSSSEAFAGPTLAPAGNGMAAAAAIGLMAYLV